MMRWTRTIWRALEISLVFATLGTALAASQLWLAVRRAPSRERRAALGRGLASICGLLGATFVKAAQYLSTRPDLVHPEVIESLERVQDRVHPFPYPEVWRTLAAELGEAPEDLFRVVDPHPVASASVAQVHRAVLADGQAVALKVLRPGVERQVDLDLALMRPLARILGWIPPLRILSPAEVLGRFGDALRYQLDLRIEADNNRRFAANFASDPALSVPALLPDLCSRRVLCMEFIEGRRVLEVEPGGAEGERLARQGFSALLRMIFSHGFVHADLHPGNLLVPDEGERLVMVDLGLVSELTPARRGQLMALMAAWMGADPDAVCAAVLLLLEGDGPADPGDLREEVAALLERYGAVRLATTSLGRVLLELLGLMRRHQLKVQPALTMVIVAIGIVEGVGRQLAPGLDLVEEARSFFMA